MYNLKYVGLLEIKLNKTIIYEMYDKIYVIRSHKNL